MSINSRIERLERNQAKAALAKIIAPATDEDFDIAAYLVNMGIMEASREDWMGVEGLQKMSIGTASEISNEIHRRVDLVLKDATAIHACVALALAPHMIDGGAAKYAAEIRENSPDDPVYTEVLAALESTRQTAALLDLIAAKIGERIDTPI